MLPQMKISRNKNWFPLFSCKHNCGNDSFFPREENVSRSEVGSSRTIFDCNNSFRE